MITCERFYHEKVSPSLPSYHAEDHANIPSDKYKSIVFQMCPLFRNAPYVMPLSIKKSLSVANTQVLPQLRNNASNQISPYVISSSRCKKFL